MSGTAAHDRAGLADAVGRVGGTLGASLSGDSLVVQASALAGRLPDILSLIAEVLTAATYPAHQVEGDRARTADQMTIALSQPETVAAEAINKRLFGRHPYGAEMPRPDAIRRVSAPRLRRLHSSLVRPSSAQLVLVGDVEPRRTIALAEEAMSGWSQVVAIHEARALMAPAAARADRFSSSTGREASRATSGSAGRWHKGATRTGLPPLSPTPSSAGCSPRASSRTCESATATPIHRARPSGT